MANTVHSATPKSSTTRRVAVPWGWLEWLLVLSIITLIGQLSAPAIYRWLRAPGRGSQGIVEFSASMSSSSLARETLVYLPRDDKFQSTGAPLLLYLHGAGDLGDDIETLKRRGLPKYLANGGDYPMIVVAPQCRSHSRWESGELMRLLDDVLNWYAVDESRIYVLGESMGGYGAWAVAAEYPQRIAAAVPLCGGGDVNTASRLTGVPIWAFHGDQDEVVPLSQSQEMVEAVQQAGGNAQLTILSNTGHDLKQIQLRRDVIEWLLKQRSDRRKFPNTRGHSGGM